jgi:hypothetical protein
MPDFRGFYKMMPAKQKINKIFLKKFLTFSEDRVIVYGLSKLGRRKWRNLTSGWRNNPQHCE